ncbi:MAG: hypothetical protein KTR35_02035 [Gammaproteobacteria bacterium]|nr:hypothetical protein [Gammaproteobacteria bacterium]
MNAKLFTGVYALFALPTYILPLLPSWGNLSYGEAPLDSPALLIHFLCLLALVGWCWLRGLQTNQPWLLSLPLLAMMFDLMPGLSWIYLLPTFLHFSAVAAGGYIPSKLRPGTSDDEL